MFPIHSMDSYWEMSVQPETTLSTFQSSDQKNVNPTDDVSSNPNR